MALQGRSAFLSAASPGRCPVRAWECADSGAYYKKIIPGKFLTLKNLAIKVDNRVNKPRFKCS